MIFDSLTSPGASRNKGITISITQSCMKLNGHLLLSQECPFFGGYSISLFFSPFFPPFSASIIEFTRPHSKGTSASQTVKGYFN